MRMFNGMRSGLRYNAYGELLILGGANYVSQLPLPKC